MKIFNSKTRWFFSLRFIRVISCDFVVPVFLLKNCNHEITRKNTRINIKETQAEIQNRFFKELE